MATVLDAAYGGASANAYLTLVDANTWIRDYSDQAEPWERVWDTGNKAALALLKATRQIDAAAAWHGNRYHWNQMLEFPRAFGTPDLGSGNVAGTAFDAVVLATEYLRQQKERVRRACCLQAVYTLAEGRDTVREEQYQGVTSSSRGHRFSESTSYGRPHLVLSPEAWDCLAPYEGEPAIYRGSAGGGLARSVVGGLP